MLHSIEEQINPLIPNANITQCAILRMLVNKTQHRLTEKSG